MTVDEYSQQTTTYMFETMHISICDYYNRVNFRVWFLSYINCSFEAALMPYSMSLQYYRNFYHKIVKVHGFLR